MLNQSFFRTMADEKGILNNQIEVTDDYGFKHYMTAEVVIEAIENAPASEQKAIKDIFSKIDFMNGDLMHFIEHLAKGLANN